jgi:hypothetical protein
LPYNPPGSIGQLREDRSDAIANDSGILYPDLRSEVRLDREHVILDGPDDPIEPGLELGRANELPPAEQLCILFLVGLEFREPGLLCPEILLVGLLCNRIVDELLLIVPDPPAAFVQVPLVAAKFDEPELLILSDALCRDSDMFGELLCANVVCHILSENESLIAKLKV